MLLSADSTDNRQVQKSASSIDSFDEQPELGMNSKRWDGAGLARQRPFVWVRPGAWHWNSEIQSILYSHGAYDMI